MSNSISHSGGISIFGVLTIVFITLKLTGVITWSWWWVLAPTWIPASLGILFLLFLFWAWASDSRL